MGSRSRSARVAGVLYLAIIAIGVTGLLYVPSVVYVSGNAAATAHSLVAHENLFRAGIFLELCGATLEIFLVLALYGLLGGVDRSLAILMVILGLMDVPIFFVNALNSFGALLFAGGADFLSAFSEPQRQAMAMLFLKLHHDGEIVNEVFWGLWLLPFGMLVYKSGFLPRFLGVWLILNCFAYLAQSVAGILLPQYAQTVASVAAPLQFGEIALTLWLLIMGVNVKRLGAHEGCKARGCA
ncbi:MAG TPA: DUF4386 domain-containing protein [Candidatus Cybelea sp.]